MEIPSRCHRGAALVVVLWVMALLGVVAASYSVEIRTETALTRDWVGSAQARAAAEAGVQLAVLEMLKQDTPEKWRTDGTVYEAEFDGAKLRIAIADEAGKVDLNKAPAELIGGLLIAAGLEEPDRTSLVDAILDWRDSDDLHRLNGAEDPDYEAAGLAYGAKDGPFESIEELSLVLGMNPDLYRKLENAITIYSGSAGINPALASRQVLLALPGFGEDQAENYLLERSRVLSEGQPEPAAPSADGQYVTNASSRTLSIYVESQTAAGAKERLVAVGKLGQGGQGQPFSVLVWKEAANLMFEPGNGS